MTSAADRVCATCGRPLRADQTHCDETHGMRGGIMGLPRAEVEATPRARRHLLGVTIDGDFVVTGFLGSGGFGAVYRARQQSLARDVALKLLALDQVGDTVSVERFQREARTAASLMDPNIATLFAFGETSVGDTPQDRLIFMAMELVEGPTLADFIRQTGGTDLPTTFTIGRNILRGLAAAHDRGVVHRDLKPGNVVLDTGKHRPWFARLIDFGIASLQAPGHTTLRSEGSVLGTPKYMAPEQWHSQPTSPATDIYAFGALLVELLTGQPAVPKADPNKMYVAHTKGPRPQITATAAGDPVPEDLQAFIERCMAVDPGQRFASARDALVSFEIVAAGSGFEDTSVSATPAEIMREARQRARAAQDAAGPREPSSIGLDETQDGSSLGLGLSLPEPSGAGLELEDRNPGAVDMGAAIAALDEPAAAPAEDAWLQAWDDAVVDQAEQQVRHLPGAGARGVVAQLKPEPSDAEFSFGPPQTDDIKPHHGAAGDPRAVTPPPEPVPPVAAAPAPAEATPEAKAPAALKPASKPADLPAPARARRPMGPGPVRDSDDDDSWGVAGAEMPKGATTARKGSARRARKAGGGGSGTNIVTIAVAVLVVVGGLVAWRLIDRNAEVQEALERDRVKPTIEMTAAEAAARTPSSAAASEAADASAPDSGVDRENSVLVIVKPGGARFIAADSKAPLCDDADRCWLPVDVDYKIEKAGYKTRAISGDDLFDRKGNKWKLLLYPEK